MFGSVIGMDQVAAIAASSTRLAVMGLFAAIG
jgi:hypothetical protein